MLGSRMRFYGALTLFVVYFVFISVHHRSVSRTSSGTATSCSPEEHILNPRHNPTRFSCGSQSWLGSKPFLPLESLPLQYSRKPPQSSEHACINGYCRFQRICVLDREIQYISSNTSVDLSGVGFFSYRGFKRTFSEHYHLRVVSAAPRNASWLPGTSLWLDQAFANICAFGHSSELYFKVPELRTHFSGPIDRVLYSVFGEQKAKNRADYLHFCADVCHMMRIGFATENFVLPAIFLWQHLPLRDIPICMETVLVPPNSHQTFTSKLGAALFRTAGLLLCEIPQRNRFHSPPRVVFHQRGFYRRILNAPTLCERLSKIGWKTSVAVTDDMQFCDRVRTIHNADIIVSTQGSHNALMAFARPGSVFIHVYPLNFIVPDWKVLAFYAGLRTLELPVTNRHLAVLPSDIHYRRERYDALLTNMTECFRQKCRGSVSLFDSLIPQPLMEGYLSHATTLLLMRQGDVLPCELPSPWPPERGVGGSWIGDGWENNFHMCEPPSPNCTCCSSSECEAALHWMTATREQLYVRFFT